MITDKEILTYYQMSQTNKLNLNSLDMEKILQNGHYENYHQNIVLTIYAILHTYKHVFSKEHPDYKMSVGGFSQDLGKRFEGLTYNFSYKTRRRFQTTEGYWVFEAVEFLYKHEPSYPNNIKNVTPEQLEEFFTFILKGYQEFIQEEYGEDLEKEARYIQEYIETRKKVYNDIKYYLGKQKAYELVQENMFDVGN